MNVFLLAAGLGTRLQPLTHKLPKPCVPFLNVPLGLYQLPYLKDLPISTLTVNTFHLPRKVENLYRSLNNFKVPINFSSEEGKLMGSSGGLKKAEDLLDIKKPILMLNSDEIFFTSNKEFLKTAYEKHLKNKNLATLIVSKHPLAGTKFGAIWCENNKVKHIGKTSSISGLKPYHYIGMIFLDPSILSFIPQDQESNIFYDTLIHLLPSKSVEIEEISCSWYETGNGPDYLAATKVILENLDTKLLSFINSFDKSRLIKNPKGISLISESIKINPEKLIGFNVISKTTSSDLLKNTDVIEDSVLFENELLNLRYFS